MLDNFARVYNRAVVLGDLMPTVYKSCTTPRCRERIKLGGVCPVHGRKNNRWKDRRVSARKRGYDSRWEKVRKHKLLTDPLCECGCGQLADTVHHRKPIETHPELRLIFENLESMTRDCHEKFHKRKKFVSIPVIL